MNKSKALILALALALAAVAGCGEKKADPPSRTSPEDALRDVNATVTRYVDSAVAHGLRIQKAVKMGREVGGAPTLEKMAALCKAADDAVDSVGGMEARLASLDREAGHMRHRLLSEAKLARQRALQLELPSAREAGMAKAERLEGLAAAIPVDLDLIQQVRDELKAARPIVAELSKAANDMRLHIVVSPDGGPREGEAEKFREAVQDISRKMSGFDAVFQGFKGTRRDPQRPLPDLSSEPEAPKSSPGGDATRAAPAKQPSTVAAPVSIKAEVPPEAPKEPVILPAGSVWVGRSQQRNGMSFPVTCRVVRREGSYVEAEAEMETPSGTGVFALTGHIEGQEISCTWKAVSGLGLDAGKDRGRVVGNVWSATWSAGANHGTYSFRRQGGGA